MNTRKPHGRRPVSLPVPAHSRSPHALAALGLLLTLTAHAAPATPAGTWYIGQTFPALAYDPQTNAYRNVSGLNEGERLVLNTNGTYLFSKITPTRYPGSFMTPCPAVHLVIERGRYSVKGDRMTLSPNGGQALKRYFAPPQTNCSGYSWEQTEEATAEEVRWEVRGDVLRFTLPTVDPNFVREWQRR